MGQPQKALDFANQYLSANQGRATAHYIYASALATDKKFDQAIPEYQKAIDLEPKGMQSYMQLARVYMITGKPDQALAVYQKAAAIQPNSPQISLAMGEVYLAKNDLKSARQAFERANQLAPNNPVVANNLAWVYALQGENLDVALSLATQAKQAAPEAPSVSDTLAWVQYRRGNYAVAVGLLDDAVKRAPQSPQYRYHLGMALSGAGDQARAKEELKKALALNLKGDDAQQAQQTLAKLQ